MAQGSRSRRIDSHVHLLRKSKLCQLPVLFGKWLNLDDPPVGSFYERVFTPPRLFWLFLAQVLSADRSCREAVQMAQAWIAVEQGDLVCTSTSAYCQGRQRLPTDWLSKLSNGILEQLASTLAGQHTWFGFRVKVVDGTTVSLADTPANQKPYRQSSRQKPGCGFPLMRLACSFCLGSGALLAWVYGGLRDSERTLWHRLWNGFSVGDLVVTDRGFCGYADIWSLSQRVNKGTVIELLALSGFENVTCGRLWTPGLAACFHRTQQALQALLQLFHERLRARGATGARVATDTTHQ